MANPNSLYSYKGAEPTGLPHRIILSNGASRTDNTSFTEEELNDAGFSGPYEKPEYDESRQEIVWDNETLMWVVSDRVFSEPQIVEKTEEELFYLLRQRRNFLLSGSDWTQTLDSPLAEEEISLWKVYRQKLRDLPSTIDNIKEFDFLTDFPIPNF